ncbi:hypothetical protein C0989_008818 [Termitomyces sp. Mn162]|nr:hypothetical protein C0989_008818 [Termitomyces sp. Mn162]
MPDHHPDSPYNLEGIFEGAKWVLKGTNTSTSKSIAIAMPTASHPGLVPTAAIAMPPPAVKSEPADSATTSTIVSTLEYLEALISAGATNCFHTSLDECHFCDETGHTMDNAPNLQFIEQTKAVFDCVLQTKIIVSVGELGSLSSDICNQFYNGVTPKHNLATNIAAANKPSEHDTFIEEILPTFTYNNATFNLSSNAATAQGILEMLVLVTAIDPVEACI